MDLVSTTLDKYLKHRFNGNGLSGRISESRRTAQSDSDMNSKTTVPETTSKINLPPLQDTMLNEANNSYNAKNNSTASEADGLRSKQTFDANSHTETAQRLNRNHNQMYDNVDKDNDVIMTNGVNDSGAENLLSIQRVSISNDQPCCVSIRDDLRYIAAGFENSHIYLWNFVENSASTTTTSSSNNRFRLLAHSGSVYCIEFINNNDLMISCSEDTTIRLWCLNTKCNVVVYRGHNYPIWSLAVGSQGKYFASTSMDATARLWRLDKITPLRIFAGHDDDVECIKFHPNEKYIATGSSDATVRLWSTSDGKMVRLMVGHVGPIISLSFNPNGKFLASASRDGVVKIWNLTTNIASREHSLPPSHTVSFSFEQKFIASCGVDNVIRVWQADSTEMIQREEIVPVNNSSRPIRTIFHGSGKLFAIAYEPKQSAQMNKHET